MRDPLISTCRWVAVAVAGLIAVGAFAGIGSAQESVDRIAISAPDTVEKSRRFEVGYSGPLKDGDQIQIAWPRSSTEDYIRSILVDADGEAGRLTAPGELGIYELRYYSASRRAVLAARAIEVVPPEIALEVPDSVGLGASYKIVWSGPASPGDRIEIVRTGFLQSGDAVQTLDLPPDGRPLELQAPIDTGNYEVRYVTGSDDAVSVTRELKVTPVPVRLEAQDGIVAGARFTVRWQGPAAPLDQIRLWEADDGPGRPLQAAAVWTPERPVTLTAPLEPGRYRIGYWSAQSETVLQETAIRVTATRVSATLNAPRSVEGGGRIPVAWTGPGAPFDEIEVARPEMPAGEHISSVLMPPAGINAEIEAPVTAGVYELRYWSSRERAVLAQRQISVTTPGVSLSIVGRVTAGTPFSVDWRGPAGHGDELRVTTPGAAPESAFYSVLLAHAGRPALLEAPDEAGTYQLRYWSGQARSVLATAILRVE